ncbi:hypothetical protein C1646_777426 [Rhizophagus diaphanus]|nr:hypothetical protein C1646_777426 [Rhizophagus diaphanus] [Rhizophagus sp. MUCL 43196]
MVRKKRVLSDQTNLQESKKVKYPEALQELHRSKCEKSGINQSPIGHQSVNDLASIVEVTLLVKINITSKREFFGVGIREIVNGIGITFFGKECKRVKKIDGIETGIAIKRNLFEINKTVKFVSKAKLYFEQVVKLQDANLVNNQKNSNNIHKVFATLENQEIKGYIDKNEKKELQSFMMKCEKRLQEELQVENLLNSIYSDCEQGIAIQVHQIIWHSATCKFAYPIAYYRINTLTQVEK